VKPNVLNIEGYVDDADVKQQLDVDQGSPVKHESDGSVTITVDQLWMTDVGNLAHKRLSAFADAVNPLNWDVCEETKSFFVSMVEVPPPSANWPKVIDETVRLIAGDPSSDVTARLQFDYTTGAIVECTYDLVPVPHAPILVDHGWVRATKFSDQVTDVNGVTGQVKFFRFGSLKTIRFRDGRRLPDAILAMVWGWGATQLVACVP
jgi:hypothetical protein